MSKRASGGTLAAFLILAAIVGFAGGAYLGTQSGEADPSSSPTDSGSTDNPNGDNPDNPDGEDDPTDEATTPPADGELTFSLGTSAAAQNERIEYSGQLSSGEENVTLQIQRSIDGGDWEDFPVTSDTGAGGEFSGYVETGRSGENSFRVVRADDDSVVSEPAVVNIG